LIVVRVGDPTATIDLERKANLGLELVEARHERCPLRRREADRGAAQG
jgi:hypothetical protein